MQVPYQNGVEDIHFISADGWPVYVLSVVSGADSGLFQPELISWPLKAAANA
jgi:hypothetical protein